MTQSAKDNLLTSQLFQNMAVQYLEFTKHEVNAEGKNFLCQLIARLEANKRHLYTKITTEEGKKILRNELTKRDALQYANIVLTLMELSNKKRDLVEKLTIAIHKGEMIEYVEPQKQ